MTRLPFASVWSQRCVFRWSSSWSNPGRSAPPRGRSERAFGTHQGRLPKELAAAAITDIASANRYLRDVYLPAFNSEFARPARERGSAFVPCADPAALDDILCEIHERVVGRDNCARFERLGLQLPADRRRPHYVKARVKSATAFLAKRVCGAEIVAKPDAVKGCGAVRQPHRRERDLRQHEPT